MKHWSELKACILFILLLTGLLLISSASGTWFDSPRVLNTLTDSNLFDYRINVVLTAELIAGIFLSCAGLVGFFFVKVEALFQKERMSNSKVGIILLLLFTIALFLRLYHLETLPWGFFLDEGFNALDARNIMDGEYFPVFLTGNGGRESLFFYGMALSLGLWGNTIFAVRFIPALIGALLIPLMFYFIRRFFHDRVALFAIIVMTFSTWQLHFSRIGFRYILLPLCCLLAFHYFDVFLEKKSYVSASIAGFFLGLGLYSYVPFRLFPLIILFYLCCRLISNRGLLRETWKQLLVYGGVAALTISPLLYFFLYKAPWVMERVNQTLAIPKEGFISVPMIQNVLKTVGMFFFWGDALLRHSIPTFPIFHPLFAAFWAIGLVVLVKNMRNPFALTSLVWYFVMLVPCMISVGIPSSSRGIGAAPVAFLCVGIGLYVVWDSLQRISLSALRLVVLTALVILVSGGVFFDVYKYFYAWPQIGEKLPRHQESLFGFSRYETALAENFHHDPALQAWLTPQLFLHPTIKFLTIDNPNVRLIDIKRPELLADCHESCYIIGEPMTRNLWWIRNSKTKNMFFWENRKKGMSDAYLGGVIQRSYGNQTPVMANDHHIFHVLSKHFTLVKTTELHGFPCYRSTKIKE